MTRIDTSDPWMGPLCLSITRELIDLRAEEGPGPFIGLGSYII